MPSRIARVLVVLIALTTLAPPAPRAQGGNDPTTLLNAEVWYLTWETSFDAAYHGTTNTQMGAVTTTSTIKRVFSGKRKLDMRNIGAVLSAPQMDAGKDPSKMTPAEIQKMTMDMMAAYEIKANWMEGPGDENADIAAVLAAKEGPAHLDYVRDDTGDDLVNETGTHYKLHVHTTRKGDASVLVSQMVFVFEIDSAAKKYWVTLPYEFGDGHAVDELTEEVVTTTTDLKGGAPDVQTTTNQITITQFPAITVDGDPSQAKRGFVVLSGDLDTSGKVSGQQTVAAHYDQGAVPGTLTFKYTLTRTPPAAAGH